MFAIVFTRLSGLQASWVAVGAEVADALREILTRLFLVLARQSIVYPLSHLHSPYDLSAPRVPPTLVLQRSDIITQLCTCERHEEQEYSERCLWPLEVTWDESCEADEGYFTFIPGPTRARHPTNYLSDPFYINSVITFNETSVHLKDVWIIFSWHSNCRYGWDTV